MRTERLPALHLPDGTLLEPYEIPEWITKEQKGKGAADFETEAEGAREKTREEARAWTTSLETKVHAALVRLALMFRDDGIHKVIAQLVTMYHTALFHQYTIPLYHPSLAPNSATPFLASLMHRFISNDAHRKATAQIRSLTSTPKRRALDEEQILSEAVEILKALEARMSDGDGWILGGSHPTSLDAALLAYLRVILKLPPIKEGKGDRVEKCELRQEVEKLKKLVRWEKGVFERYFAKR